MCYSEGLCSCSFNLDSVVPPGTGGGLPVAKLGKITMDDRIKRGVLIMVALTFSFGISFPVSAHHGTAIAYDIQHPVTLKGTVTEFRFANPHCQIYFDVTDDKGQVVNWAGELNSTYSLIQDGWTRKRSIEALKPGTAITVILLPGRSGNPV